MADEANQALAVAVGTLTGTVTAVMKALDDQNKSSAINRQEFLKALEDNHKDTKEALSLLSTHIKEDSVMNQAVVELMTWKGKAEGRVDILWDTKNKQSGAAGVMGIIGSIIGGLLVAGVDLVTRK